MPCPVLLELKDDLKQLKMNIRFLINRRTNRKSRLYLVDTSFASNWEQKKSSDLFEFNTIDFTTVTRQFCRIRVDDQHLMPLTKPPFNFDD